MSNSVTTVDVVVIGAGAAGLMCAIQAGRRGRHVLAIDHWRTIGERIRISGGGRCNFTNRTVSAVNYLSRNPHFCHSALARFTAADFIAMVDQHGVAYEERDGGQLFCTGSAQDITRMLVADCNAAGVRIEAPCDVHAITTDCEAPGGRSRFAVTTSQGTVACDSVVVSTGGLAVPKLGATPFGYRIAAQFGLSVVPPQPGLVPLSLGVEDLTRLAPLSGVAFPATVSCVPPYGPSFTASVLITHRGLSGPAILQISNYWQRNPAAADSAMPISINLLPGVDAFTWLDDHRSSKALLSNALSERLPRRFVRAWSDTVGLDKPLNQMSRVDLDLAARTLSDWTLVPTGTLGFEKAEVTLGGVDTDELSSKTMESTKVPGLYFIGEVVDVTGWLGGYNFQWAWSSGWAAGQYA